jgi:hypothetical protein
MPMQISSRSFPHPVLTPFSDDLIECDFQCALSTETTAKEYKLVALIKVSNRVMQKLVQNGQGVFALHIECPATRYRTMLKSKENEFSFDVPVDRLDGRFQICAFILAEQDFDYYNPNFHPDYEGATFSVRKGDILAADETKTYYAEKILDTLKQIPSIFTIARNDNQDAPPIDIDAQGNKIVILLAPRQYERYLHLRLDQVLRPVLNAIIVFPALTHILDLINPENQADGPSDREDLRWYRVLRIKLAEQGIHLEAEEALPESAVNLASKLIGDPIADGMEILSGILEED